MTSGFTAGLEADVAFPVSPAYRVGVAASASEVVWGNEHPTVMFGAVELRHVGAGMRHFDVGVLGGGGAVSGGGMASTDAIAFVGARLALAWEGATSGVSVSFVPVIAADARGVIPGAFVSLRWELPL